jgi:hypothetical protein
MHVTKFNGEISDIESINASVFQGSAVGPPMFVINGIDLKPINKINFIDKYADDTYLIVPSCNDDTVDSELQAIERWASSSNLKLNKKKSQEIIIFSNDRSRAKSYPVSLISEIERVTAIKILGVTIQNNLSMKSHVINVCQSAAQNLYALKILKCHGMDNSSLLSVCKATVVSRLTYCATSWWGFASKEDKLKLQSMLNRARRWGFYLNTDPSIEQICNSRDDKLLSAVMMNPNHVLYQFLPPKKEHNFSLRARVHNRQLPTKCNSTIEKNFFIECCIKIYISISYVV